MIERDLTFLSRKYSRNHVIYANYIETSLRHAKVRHTEAEVLRDFSIRGAELLTAEGVVAAPKLSSRFVGAEVP